MRDGAAELDRHLAAVLGAGTEGARADQVGFDAQTELAALLDPLWLGSGRACPSCDEAAED
ncbi:hypothetical protein [Elioraea sp.]|jgi:hypothetical protein|uniref:hypothetical protein n=1 Tax=Elioraea sp. TaxID=2185103 RepID=UPI0021DCECF0|nr:hypothetical protein [Elioraea sp.]GIX12016.1 MAG: hypothetical protein KatS3mg116_3726 [Elioraea sp.]